MNNPTYFRIFIGPGFAFKLMLSLCAVSIMIRTLELLVKRRLFAADGYLSWQLMEELCPFERAGWLRPFVSARGFCWVLFARLTAACGLLVCSRPAVLVPCLVVLVLSSLLLILRIPVGQDGSDQMNIVILIPALFALLCHQELAKVAVLVFVAAQVSLAYATSGIAKLISPLWRSGQAIPRILSTLSFGNAISARVFNSHPTWAWIASWSAMAFETLFSLWLLAGPRGSIVILAIGVGFHLSCAMLMGLNCFFWSFLATYPAVLFCSIKLADLAHS